MFGFGFWAFIFIVLFRLLRYFRGVQDIGPLLAGKLLGLILVGFFSILMLSNIITALSSFFLARDLDLLVVGAGRLVQALRREAARDARALELDGRAAWRSRCSRRTAWCIRGGPLFPLIVLATFLPFLIIPTVIGSAFTLLLVNIFPARRTRDILSVIAVLDGGRHRRHVSAHSAGTTGAARRTSARSSTSSRFSAARRRR